MLRGLMTRPAGRHRAYRPGPQINAANAHQAIPCSWPAIASKEFAQPVTGSQMVDQVGAQLQRRERGLSCN